LAPPASSSHIAVPAHLETNLVLARDGGGNGQAVPGSVERKIYQYLSCDILS
jgi:hypothetical protein